MKKGLDLDRVVLLGRTFEEYARYFLLDPAQLRGQRILDVASGVSSFCAEANAQGIYVTAFDPIYALPPETIAARCDTDLDQIVRSIDGLKVYRWEFYQNPERLREFRNRAWRTFLQDYASQRAPRYHAGALPRMPFAEHQFDRSLLSYFLFVYQEQFSYEFHRDSILELMRVTAGEARVYPTTTFEGERSLYLNRLIQDPTLQHLRFEEIATDFEFLVNSNSFLSIRHR